MRKLAKADLQRSDITWEEAEFAGIEYVSKASDIYEDFQSSPALLLPYYDPWTNECMEFERDGELLPFCRVRYLKQSDRPKGFKKHKAIRYGQPSDSGVFPYFPLVEHFDWQEVAEDASVPLVITEGEKKALRGCLAGYPTIGLGGVYNFMRDGELLPFLDRFIWKKRKLFLNYDSDAADNPNIQAAEGRLATELSTKRRANVFLVRLPEADDGSKQGLDDYIVNHGGGEAGEKEWQKALRCADQINKSDAKVLDMNRKVCIIEADEALYRFQTDEFMTKQHFVNGSRFSTDYFLVPAKKGTGVNKVYVAPIFLKHELSLRYDDIIFDLTTEERVVEKNGTVCLNRWTGWEGAEEGDVTPFLELTKHVSRGLQADQQDFLLNLMAYKFQNPAVKIPICIVLVGTGGSGKSMWASMIREAADPYGVPITNNQLESEFNGWIERAVFGVLDEAQGETVRRRRDYLKTLISEKELSLNEKYRKAKVVSTPTFYILTSNDKRAGSFEHDDRRMFVINVDHKLPAEWYVRAGEWLRNERGGKKLLHFMLSYDLKGWRPPNEAPMTAEKVQAYQESLTPVQQIAETMKGADQNIVLMWCDAAMAWATEHDGSSNPSLSAQAAETRVALRHMPIRSFYTPDELAKLFPHMAWTLSGQKTGNTPSGQLSRELRSSGIRYLLPKDDPRGFFYKGMFRQFLVVADMEEIPETMSQNEFDRQIKKCPSFGQIRGYS